MSVVHSVGIPVLSVNIINSGDTYAYAVGDTITGAIIRYPYETKEVTGTILAMHLFDKPDMIGNTNIIDGIESGKHIRKYAEMKCVEEEFSVDTMLIDVTPDGATEMVTEVIHVADIETIGEYVNPDGTAIRTLTPSEEGTYDLATAVSEAGEGDTLKMKDGDCVEELTIDKGMTLRGANSGIAQN